MLCCPSIAVRLPDRPLTIRGKRGRFCNGAILQIKQNICNYWYDMFWILSDNIAPHQLQLFVPWPWVQQLDVFQSGDAGSLTLTEGRRNNDTVHVSIRVTRHWYEPSNIVGFLRNFWIYKPKCNHKMQFKVSVTRTTDRILIATTETQEFAAASVCWQQIFQSNFHSLCRRMKLVQVLCQTSK